MFRQVVRQLVLLILGHTEVVLWVFFAYCIYLGLSRIFPEGLSSDKDPNLEKITYLG